ncbi:hypothetical protein FJZ40_00610, partial [Candidatus Shapirobacteria bacterium]|nr:hypothetical protein [Candidatus Shapirobacteria bacterium]
MKRLKKNRVLLAGITLFFFFALATAFYLSQKTQETRKAAAPSADEETSLASGLSAVNYYGTPLNVLKLFGQFELGETSEDTPTKSKLFHPAGLAIDKSVTPNRIYVVDSGNNRILGFNGSGTCSGASCVDTDKPASIIIGQSDICGPSGCRGACNGDSNIGIHGQTAADKLCLMLYPWATNIGESWGRILIDVDSQGNLYVPDIGNNRILKYNQPFGGDSVADFVWGQENYTARDCNRGRGRNNPDNQSLCLDIKDTDTGSARGVSVDASGNLWVADIFNHRVLRFPPGSKTADLVLGQTTFNTKTAVCSSNPTTTPLNTMCSPALARVNPQTGELFVMDEHPTYTSRILVFAPPFTNGA